MEDIIRNIRKDCRLAMNGVVSASMRDYGLDYKLNFGLVALQIKAIADKYGPSAPLADQLWTENTRELKIISTLIYPIEEFSRETANKWVAEISNQEIREQVCFNLFQNLPFATELGKEWSNSSNPEIRTTGYWLIVRLMLTKKIGEEINSQEFDKYIWNDAISPDLFLRNASSLVLKHLIRRSKDEADKILDKFKHLQNDTDPIRKEAYESVAFEIEFIYS